MSRGAVSVTTPYGEARLVHDAAPEPVATLLLGHGAGGGVDARDLVALAQRLPLHDISVVRLEQPWRVAGRRIAPAPAVLDVCLRAAAAHVDPGTPLVLGGRSAGARSAARCARELGAAAYLALAFPLHPPGRPERSRLEELEAVRLPTLVVQGERDALGRPEEFPEPLPAGCELAVVPGADHAFAVRKRDRVTAEETMAFLVRRTLGWLARTVPGNRT